MPRYAGVVVEAPLKPVFYYSIPADKTDAIRAGSRVLVPLGRRQVRGVCVELADTVDIPEDKIRPIHSVSDSDDIVPDDILRLTRWVADYYRSSWGMVLAAAVPAAVRKDVGRRTLSHAVLVVSAEEARQAVSELALRAKKQAHILRRILESASDTPLACVEIEQACNASRSSILGLANRGLIRIEERSVDLFAADESVTPSTSKPELTPRQTNAVRRLADMVHADRFAPFLLHGVTGSGKTEVYLHALEEVLARGKTGLVLVPEISLTPQTVARFRARVGQVAVLHSYLSESERAAEWRRIRSGEIRVVVGARSAVFAPLADLGVIIVDEEHERTFKQENDPRYHARDVAVVRAQQNNAVIVLGSATPSLESWENVSQGKYELLSLPERVGGGRPPKCVLVDMRNEYAESKRQVVLSRPLHDALRSCLQRKEQAILFLNRRGFNTFAQCRTCGDTIRCEHCDIALTHHKSVQRLLCHYCGYNIPIPSLCPMCSRGDLYFSGTGTERIDHVLEKVFPEARVLRMDSDTMTGRGDHEISLSAFGRGDYDILLGTQMVAKGLDFPNVTLVGVLASDSAINLPDFRAVERTFQLVTQVAGRAGRAAKPGLAVLQAFQTDHYALQYALKEDYIGFAQRELADRRSFGYPPYGRLTRLVARSKKAEACETSLQTVATAAKSVLPGMGQVLGPVRCPLGKIQAEHRFQVLLKAGDVREMTKAVRVVEKAWASPHGVYLAIDVDPVSLL